MPYLTTHAVFLNLTLQQHSLSPILFVNVPNLCTKSMCVNTCTSNTVSLWFIQETWDFFENTFVTIS